MQHKPSKVLPVETRQEAQRQKYGGNNGQLLGDFVLSVGGHR
jgi:hypothetical protein